MDGAILSFIGIPVNSIILDCKVVDDLGLEVKPHLYGYEQLLTRFILLPSSTIIVQVTLCSGHLKCNKFILRKRRRHQDLLFSILISLSRSEDVLRDNSHLTLILRSDARSSHVIVHVTGRAKNQA